MSQYTQYIILSDSNCIQVRAPDDKKGSNNGDYEPGEHIGNLRREWTAKLAPIIDFLTASNSLHTVTFDCCLCDGDTSHARNGYALNIVILSTNDTDFNHNLINLLRESHLQC